ncbi:copper resistance protein CopC [Agromyces aurantiacus]|uniref:Copper resistance protein CopC n=1 Tax=Agromyces aurantiacus TaxID=165814 RepID=A0ABV9R0Q1_9MICO|nr:copper resistance CopC family protein [Agromyces aurantiacus]MBM7505826.1 methionine-rich copper-binding protein CopC [Agromyces aurantiacus]
MRSVETAPRALPRALAALALLAGAVGAGVLAGPAAPAIAHNRVIGESPKAESTVTSQPGSVAIETSDALLDVEGATAMDVLGPDGRHYATACPSVDGPVASVPVELGAEGEYTVEWRVVSADGHPITGEFGFTWAPADGEPIADGADAPACASAGSETGGAATDAGGGAGGEADAAASGGLGDLLWVVGGAAVVVVAGLAAFLLARRRPAAPVTHGSAEPAVRGEPDEPHESGEPGDADDASEPERREE